MTAYVLNASGNWNNPLIWTPNGVPGESDTATAGTFELTIPVGYVAKTAGLVMTGTSAGARSRFLVAGTLEQYGDCSNTNHADVYFIGNGNIDTRGHKFEVGTGTAGATTKVSNDKLGICKIWSSTTKGYFGRPAAQQKSGDLDLDGFLCVNVDFRYGGNFNAGNHYRIRNFIFYNCGYIDNYDYIHPTADWVLENGDFDGSQVTSGSNIYLWARNSSGTISGQRLIKDVTFDYRTSPIKKVTFRYLNSAIETDGIYALNTGFEFLDSSTLILKKFFSAMRGIVGDFSGDLTQSYITPNLNNPHTLENFIAKTYTDSVLENIQPVGSTDGADHLICRTGAADVLTKRVLFRDNYGGVLYNALKANTIGKFVLDKCTYSAVIQSPTYGCAARNESGQKFMPASDLRLQSCIFHVRSNPSGAANIRIVNLETAGDDQVKFIDHNAYNGFGTNNATKFFGMTSAVRGAYGTEAGWGLNDIHNVDPLFVDESRGIVSWGAQFGYANYDETCVGIRNSVNGYDPATQTQNGNVPGRSVMDLLNWVTAGHVPQEALYAGKALDGSTMGAFEYVATADPSVDTINGGNPITVGQSGVVIEHSGYSGAITSVTTNRAGVICTIVSSDADETIINVSGWGEGGFYPELNDTVTFTVSRSGETASGDQVLIYPAGWVKQTFVGAITNDPELFGKIFSDAGHTVEGADLFYLPYDDLVIDADTDGSVTNGGTFNAWLRPVAGTTAGKMYYFELNILDGGSAGSAAINSVGAVRIGGTTTVSVSNFATPVNAGTLDGKALAAASNTQISCFALANGVATYRPGMRALVLTNGSVSDTIDVPVLPPIGWGAYEISADFIQAINGVAANYLPAGWAVNHFIFYPLVPSAGKTTTVGDAGVVTGNVGTQVMFLVHATTGMATAFNVTTTAGAAFIGVGGDSSNSIVKRGFVANRF